MYFDPDSPGTDVEKIRVVDIEIDSLDRFRREPVRDGAACSPPTTIDVASQSVNAEVISLQPYRMLVEEFSGDGPARPVESLDAVRIEVSQDRDKVFLQRDGQILLLQR
ncbi:MAG: hypothetical protein AAFX94_17750 [Myxococcota bacterium]